MPENAVNKVVIMANDSKARVMDVALKFMDYLRAQAIDCAFLRLSSTLKDLQISVPDCDLVVSLGGDGTVLTCACILKGRGIPILAVNMGSFGYITETPVDEIQKVFTEYQHGNTGIQSRMMLDVNVIRKGSNVFSSCSLNDITVSAISHARTAKLDLYLNKVLGAKLRADGIIIATPTGSTAYSLAAGGPILDASLEAIIINPICPFTMSVRPIVVTKDSEITLVIPEQNTDVSLTCDGHEVFSLQKDDQIIIKEGSSRALFIENPRRVFIEVLRDKLGWAGAFNA